MSQKTNDVFEDEGQQTSSSVAQQFENMELNPDPKVLEDLEKHAQTISSNLDMALRDLRGALRGISDLSLESMQVFHSIVNDTCESVDTVIRSTYTMVAKAEELHACLEGIQRLSLQIKDMKKMVEVLENHFNEIPPKTE